MKKTTRLISLLLALVMVASLMTGCANAKTNEVTEHSVPMDDMPEGHEEQDVDEAPAPTEAPAPEPTAAPTPEPTAAPTPEPTAAPTPEPTAAPTPEPTAAPTPEPTAAPTPEPTEAPTPEPTAAPTPEPTAEPTPEPAPEPTAEPVPEVTEAPEATEAPVTNEAPMEPSTIDLPEAPVVTATPVPAPELRYVELHCPDATFVGWSDFTVTLTMDGKLPVGFDWYQPQRDSYEFAGWYAENYGTGEPQGKPYEQGDEVPADVTDLYAGWKPAPEPEEDLWILLHVVNGNFGGTYSGSDPDGQSYSGKDLKDLASIYVKLDAGRKLPSSVSSIVPTRTNGTFKGWFTAAPSERHETKDGGYDVWHTDKINGTQIQAGGIVPEDVQVLYAAFDDKQTEDDSDKLVTYYLDWNGINGMWGHCLTSSRKFSSESQGYALTAGDLLVRYLNWNDDKVDGITDQAGLAAYWNGKSFDGYTFLGWADTPSASAPNVWPGYVVKSGDSIYAVWAKGDDSSQSFDRTDPNAGPVKNLRLMGVTGSHSSGSMTWTTHAKAGNSIQFSVTTDPIRATFKTLTWTVQYNGKTATLAFEAGGDAVTQTMGNVTLTAMDRNLILSYGEGEGEQYASFTVNVSAANEDGSSVANPGVAGTALFSHNWDKGVVTKVAEKCLEATVTTFTCADCKATYTTEKIKQHLFSRKVVLEEPTCTTAGKYQYFCQFCDQQGGSGSIPALGHDMQITNTEKVSCRQNKLTKDCQRAGCDHSEISYVYAYNPELHDWQRQDVTVNCTNTIIRERCSECGRTQTLYEPSSAPDAHQFNSYTTPLTCSTSKLTRYCIWCNKIEESTIKASNLGMPHVWGDWKTVREATEWQGGQQERACKLCGHKQTKVTAALVRPETTPVESNAGASQQAGTTNASTTAASTAAIANAASTKLSAPKVKGVSNTTSGVKITWGKVSGAEKYRVYYKTGSGGWKKLTDTTGTSYTWKNAKSGTKYSFTVRCVSKDGKKTVSSYDTKGKSLTYLAAPKVSKVAKVTGGIKITWGKVSGAAKYRVFYKTGNGGWKKLVDVKGTSYTWKNAKSGTKYSFTVRCISANGKSYTSDYNTTGKSITYKK